MCCRLQYISRNYCSKVEFVWPHGMLMLMHFLDAHCLKHKASQTSGLIRPWVAACRDMHCRLLLVLWRFQWLCLCRGRQLSRLAILQKTCGQAWYPCGHRASSSHFGQWAEGDITLSADRRGDQTCLQPLCHGVGGPSKKICLSQLGTNSKVCVVSPLFRVFYLCKFWKG